MADTSKKDPEKSAAPAKVADKKSAPAKDGKPQADAPAKDGKPKADAPAKDGKGKADAPAKGKGRKRKADASGKGRKRKADAPAKDDKPKADAPAPATDKPKKKKNLQNIEARKKALLADGLYKLSRRKTSVYKFISLRRPSKRKDKRQMFVIKPIGGEKNGGTRKVYLYKRPRSYPTADRIRKHKPRYFFKNHKRHLRSSIAPGKILILLAGVHKGRRVVFLKQLETGMLLITGPYKLNGVPIRQVHQSLVIATSTQIDISDINIPNHINKKYFKRAMRKRTRKVDGDIFVAKKEVYKPSEQRKIDQKIVDKQVMASIKKCKGRVILLQKYLRTMFSLRSNMYPHKMKF